MKILEVSSAVRHIYIYIYIYIYMSLDGQGLNTLPEYRLETVDTEQWLAAGSDCLILEKRLSTYSTKNIVRQETFWASKLLWTQPRREKSLPLFD